MTNWKLLNVYAIALLGSISAKSLDVSWIPVLRTFLGVSDAFAGQLRGYQGIAIMIIGAFTSPLIDRVGIRNCAIYGYLLMIVAKTGMIIGGDVGVYLCMFLPYVAGLCLQYPSLQAAIQAYTERDTPERDVAIDRRYFALNVGFIVVGPLMDGINWVWPEKATSIRVLLIMGIISDSVVWLLLIAWFKDFVWKKEDNFTCKVLPMMLKDQKFWAMFSVCVCVMWVSFSSTFSDLVYVPYMQRAFAPEKIPYNSFLSWDPFIILTCTLPLRFLLRKIDRFKVMIVGGAINAASTFLMCAGINIWCVQAFIIVNTLGEIMYYPSWQQWSSNLSSDSYAVTYNSYSQVPNDVMSMAVKFIGGDLLHNNCGGPAPTECPHPLRMWFYIGLIGLPTPVMLCVMYFGTRVVEHKYPLSSVLNSIEMTDNSESDNSDYVEAL